MCNFNTKIGFFFFFAHMLYGKYMKIKIFCFISIFLIITKVKSSDFIDKGYYVVDLANKVEWLKCTVGQLWDENKKKYLPTLCLQ